MFIPRIDKSFLYNIILMFQGMRMRGFLTLDIIGIMNIPDPRALGVARNMRVGIWQVEMVVIGVVIVAT